MIIIKLSVNFKPLHFEFFFVIFLYSYFFYFNYSKMVEVTVFESKNVFYITLINNVTNNNNDNNNYNDNCNIHSNNYDCF